MAGRFRLSIHSRSAVHLLSFSLNKTGVISPRYNVQLRDMEKWVVKLLPSRQFGYIVLTTSAGIMDHEEARRKHVAGKIIGFFY
jgi:small subunit ribosomal protein S15Ae